MIGGGDLGRGPHGARCDPRVHARASASGPQSGRRPAVAARARSARAAICAWHKHLLPTNGARFAEAWNFGPAPRAKCRSSTVVTALVALWGLGARWELDGDGHPHEAAMLKLDWPKARETPQLAAGDRFRPERSQ